MLLQAVEIILEHCAVLQPELRREEQGGCGLHHAAKVNYVKAPSHILRWMFVAGGWASQSAPINQYNFLYQAFAELLLRVGSVGADASVACAVGNQEGRT